MNLAAQEAIWLRNFLVEVTAALTGVRYEELYDDPEAIPQANIHMPKLGPTFVLCDNLGAVHTSAIPVSSKRSEHVDIRYLKIREYQEQQRLAVKHVDGNKNIADVLPKYTEYLKYILTWVLLALVKTKQASKKHPYE